MGKKIIDEARMIGVLPSQGADPIPVGKIPDGATQILKRGNADDSVTTIYTVTAGKTLYLCFACMGYLTVAAGVGQLYLLDGESVVLMDIFLETVLAAGAGRPNIASFFPPIELPGNYMIRMNSSAAGLGVYGSIYGYEL